MDEEKKNENTQEIVDTTGNIPTNTSTNTQTNTQTNKSTEPKKEKKGFCIASMVLGIVCLVFFCVWYLSIPCGILAIIFGILGIKSTSKGMAIAGLITGSIGLVVSILIVIFIIIFGMAVGFSEVFDDYDSSYYNRNYHHRYNIYN